MEVPDTFFEALNIFLLDRSHSEEDLQKCKEYLDAEKEINNIFDCLETYFPDEQKNGTPHQLLRNCSDLKDVLVALGNEYGYRQGFSEGIRMLIYSLMLK